MFVEHFIVSELKKAKNYVEDHTGVVGRDLRKADNFISGTVNKIKTPIENEIEKIPGVKPVEKIFKTVGKVEDGVESVLENAIGKVPVFLEKGADFFEKAVDEFPKEMSYLYNESIGFGKLIYKDAVKVEKSIEKVGKATIGAGEFLIDHYQLVLLGIGSYFLFDYVGKAKRALS